MDPMPVNVNLVEWVEFKSSLVLIRTDSSQDENNSIIKLIDTPLHDQHTKYLIRQPLDHAEATLTCSCCIFCLCQMSHFRNHVYLLKVVK